MQNIIFLLLGAFLVVTPPKTSIKLMNPSFEGEPQDATTPQGWDACGLYSTPDILPGPWGVYQKPSEGQTFIGLISREDGTWEYLGQQLTKPMKATKCYNFNIQLARSTGYVGYNRPLRLRIWGGTKKCKKEEMLGASPAIKHLTWKNYEFNFFPKKKYTFITLEAYYVGDEQYRGNLFIDNCSSIESCDRVSIDMIPTNQI